MRDYITSVISHYAAFSTLVTAADVKLKIRTA